MSILDDATKKIGYRKQGVTIKGIQGQPYRQSGRIKLQFDPRGGGQTRRVVNVMTAHVDGSMGFGLGRYILINESGGQIEYEWIE